MQQALNKQALNKQALNKQSLNKQRLHTILVDDEPLARRSLSLMLEAMDDVHLVAECSSGAEALNRIAELAPDLVFFDIQMPGMSGFELVTKLQQDAMPLVVFVTAHDDYAVEAFNHHAVDYLLKPVQEARLRVALDRAQQNKNLEGAAQDKQRLLELLIGITGRTETSVAQLMQDYTPGDARQNKLAIKKNGEIQLVPVADIDWIDATGDYMCIHTVDETHIMRSTMQKLEQLLDPVQFQRVHRSTIVNLERVTQVCPHQNGEFHLLLANGTSIKMSRTYKDKVKHFL